MSANNYYESKTFPLVAKLKDAIKKMATQFTVMEAKIKSLIETVNCYKIKVAKLVQKLIEKDKQIERLQEKADVLDRVIRYSGAVQIDKINELERQQVRS